MAMIVTVHSTRVGAAARSVELLALHRIVSPIAPARVAAEATHRRPVGHRRRWRRLQACEVAGGIDDLATDDGQVRDGIGDLALGAGEVVAVGDDQVGELAGLDAPLLAFLVGEPGDVLGPHAQRRLAVAELGRIVAGAFAQPELAGHGEHMPLVGDFLSFDEIVATLNRQGHKVSFRHVPREVFAGWFPGANGVAAMLAYFEAHTYLGSDSGDAITLANKVAGQQPTQFAQWARTHFPTPAPTSHE